MALPVALQLYSIRDYASKDLRASLQAVKDMGYDGIELAGLYNYAPSDIKAMANEIGLVPISAHVAIKDLMADTEGTIAKYDEIGCKYIAIPHLSDTMRPGGSEFENTLVEIKKIGEAAKKFGIQLLYHNHDFEFVRVNGEYGLDVIYNSIPADLLKTEIDTCWVKVAGEDPVEYVKKYTGRAPIVHLKDFTGSKSKEMYELIGVDKKAETKGDFEFRPVGHGVQDMPSIVAAAISAGAEWVVVEMDKPCCDKTAMECAEMGREYLKTIGY